MHDKDEIADNQTQQRCEDNINHINTLPQQSATQREKKQTLGEIIRQIKKQTQQDKKF